MRLHSHSTSKISLQDVLRRRKTTLKDFLNQSGIVTYNLLAARCKSMGVIPPSEEQFLTATGTKNDTIPKLSSPAEGVIVLPPPDLISESTGKMEKNIEEVTQPIYSKPPYPKKQKKLSKFESEFAKKKITSDLQDITIVQKEEDA